MHSIRILQTCALGNGTRQPGDLLGTYHGHQSTDEVLGLAWDERRLVAGVVPAEGVTPDELLTALRNPHLIQFVATQNEPAAEPDEQSVEQAIAELESRSPLAAADDEPQTIKKKKRP